jgi:molybdopterin converting factor small subunit
MEIQVKLFAAARELAGAGLIVKAFPPGMTVQDVAEVLFETYPGLRKMKLQFAVNAIYARPETPLKDGDQVAFIPPVGGG